MTADDRLLNEADRAASAVYAVAERVVADAYAEQPDVRVRAVADAYAEQPDVMEPCGASAQSIRFALDDMPCHCLCHERQGGGVHTGMRCVCNGGEGHD